MDSPENAGVAFDPPRRKLGRGRDSRYLCLMKRSFVWHIAVALLATSFFGCAELGEPRCEEPEFVPREYTRDAPRAAPMEVSVEVPEAFDKDAIEDSRTAIIHARDFVTARRFIDASVAYSRAIVLSENQNPTILCEAAKIAHVTNQDELAAARFDRAERLLRRMPASVARDGASADCFRLKAETTEDTEAAIELYKQALALNENPAMRERLRELEISLIPPWRRRRMGIEE